MNASKKTILLLTALVLGAASLFGGVQKKEQHVFKGKDEVRIKTVSGDVTVKTGGGGQIVVDVIYDVTPEGSFEPVLKEYGGTLRIREEWRGSRSSGRVSWLLTVPPKTAVDISTASGDVVLSGLTEPVEVSTASGDIDVSDVKGDVQLKTASGDVDFFNGEGELEITTASGDVDAGGLKGIIDISCASGDIDLDGVQGVIHVSCASGDVDARGVILTEAGSFSTASGDVDVVLAKTPAHDLTVSSSSGDACLDYSGNELKGVFEMTAKKRNGRITAPYAFDTEDEYESWDQTYIKKVFKRSASSPLVRITTASGSAVLRK